MPLQLPLTDEFLDSMRLLGDPLADETLQKIIAENGPGEARKLFDLLIRQVELPLGQLPAAAQDFLQKTNQLPAWTDWGKVKLANDLFLDHGPKFLVFLYYKSLPILYSCAHGAKVLVQTGRLAHDGDDMAIFARRIAETGQFLLDVTAPAALKPGGKGIQAIQKVRLIHASIRAFTPAEKWDVAALGVPVNQEDMAVTLMTFCQSLTSALSQFNVPENQERLEAYLHLWAAIGEVLGVHPGLLPNNLEEARLLLEKILERQSKESEEGKILTQSLLNFARQVLPIRFQKMPELLMYHLVGLDLSKKLGVLPNIGCLGSLVPDFLRTVFQLGERLEDRVKEPLQFFIQELGKATTIAMVGYFDRFKGRNFEVPTSLQHRWLGDGKGEN